MLTVKAAHPLKIYQQTKFHGFTLGSLSFALPQQFESPPFLNG
jgi:hypothetical protein